MALSILGGELWNTLVDPQLEPQDRPRRGGLSNGWTWIVDEVQSPAYIDAFQVWPIVNMSSNFTITYG